MKRLLFIIPLFMFCGCQKQFPQPQWNLTHTAPAQIWEECFPLGNGHLGMMPDGGVEEETIVLNDIQQPPGLAIPARDPKTVERRQERRSPEPDVRDLRLRRTRLWPRTRR